MSSPDSTSIYLLVPSIALDGYVNLFFVFQWSWSDGVFVLMPVSDDYSGTND